jgi:hypothetical protein
VPGALLVISIPASDVGSDDDGGGSVLEVGGPNVQEALRRLQNVARRVADGCCYDARRAAALSGVPLSTLYQWARRGIIEPSASAERPRLWSYADLMALRIVSRHTSRDPA